MKRIGTILCILLMVLASVLPLVAAEPVEKTEIVRTGMTLLGAAAGLGAGAAIALGFSLDAMDTPLSNTLLLTIPVAAAGAATGALTGRWIADAALANQPSPLFAILGGAWRGLFAGALVGSVTFTLNFLIAYPTLDVPEGYWGRFDYLPTIGLAIAAGGFWGGFYGVSIGGIAMPAISIYMEF